MTPPIEHEWRMCACERALPAHVDTAPDPASGPGCGMAWRPTADRAETSNEIEELHVSDMTHIGVQPGGHFRQDVPAGPALPNHPAERTRRNRMVSPPERPEPVEDPRFTMGLLHDVITTLEAHGYHAPEGDSRVYAHSLLALMTLVRAFEGLPLDSDAPQTPGVADGGEQR